MSAMQAPTRLALAEDEKAQSLPREAGPGYPFAGLAEALAPSLAELLAPTLAARLAELLAPTLAPANQERESIGSIQRRFYTVQEAAQLLGKADYTVRQWCLEGRINAAKRSGGRSKAGEWSIPADEIERYRDFKLLKPDHRRNCQS